MERSRYGTFLIVLGVAAILLSCGDSPTTPPPPPPPPPPTPAASLAVSGHGDIVVHPSASGAFAVAIEFPLRIEETAGGTAVWNFFRVSYFLNGREIERNEQGADQIEAQGFRNISARATIMPDVITRTNALDWDDIEIRLGFTDNLDGRAFEQTLSLDSFDGVVIDLTPALLPENSNFAIVESFK